MTILDWSAAELVARYRARTLSPVDVTRAVLGRIAETAALNAFAHVGAESALADAEASEARWQRGEPAGLLDDRAARRRQSRRALLAERALAVCRAVQPDPTACAERSQRAASERSADRSADRRPTLRRPPGAARSSSVRTSRRRVRSQRLGLARAPLWHPVLPGLAVDVAQRQLGGRDLEYPEQDG